ncbi:SpoIIE family protein phosphatase [candidate division KSB1 bacterium]|nr:SpoIIE family protein phosphatase [candidate division KSB1 bacterium]
MDTEKLLQFRSSLVCHRDALLEWLNSGTKHHDIRLGNAELQDVLQVVTDIKDALVRIDNGHFGRCIKCNGEVETEFLESDYTNQVCLDHFSQPQLRRLERDLEFAAKIQSHLLPCCVPSLPGIEIAAYTESAQIVGGDYYDFFSYPDGSQGFAIGDVMGKGLSASMLMSHLQASLRILGPENKNLHEVANRLNELFRYNMKLISFISLILARLDIETSIFYYCNAGHNPPLWWNSAAKRIKSLYPTGPAIGLAKNANYLTNQIHYQPGDILIMYTDGLTEAGNTKGEEFGMERFENYMLKLNKASTVQEIISGLVKEVKAFAGKFNDDVTVLAFRFE